MQENYESAVFLCMQKGPAACAASPLANALLYNSLVPVRKDSASDWVIG